MAIRMEILYNCAVKETLFLGKGWGVRDVRGPYLEQAGGEICFPSYWLDNKFTTTVELTFSLSNRSEQEGVEIQCYYLGESKRDTVLRNGSVTLILSSLLRQDSKFLLVRVLSTMLNITPSGAVIEPTADLVSIDKIRLYRNIEPTKFY